MTADEICDAALARCAEFSDKVPSARSVMWHRINARQQQLFSHIADLEPEYFGTDETLVLTAGVVDLATLDPLAERVTHVEVSDPGASGLATRTTINVVPVMDIGAALAPRCTIRDFVLAGVAGELDDVTSVKVFHSKRANTVDAGDVVIQIPAQFTELLVIDLARHQMRKALSLDAKTRTEILDLLTAEEKEMMQDLDRHLEHWRYAETARFEHSQQAQPRPHR